jgi:hypothetical protein
MMRVVGFLLPLLLLLLLTIEWMGRGQRPQADEGAG